MKLSEALETVDAKAQVLATLEGYVAHCNADYEAWHSVGAVGDTDDQIEWKAKRVEEFKNGWEFNIGRKWIKVVKTSCGQRSVHSFICIEPLKGFKVGDIAKPASFHQPAKNFARGNVLTGDLSRVSWTGAL